MRIETRGRLSLLGLVEEEHLLRTFGSHYADYSRAVPRWFGRRTEDR